MGGVAFQLSFLEARPSRCSRIATFPSLFATRECIPIRRAVAATASGNTSGPAAGDLAICPPAALSPSRLRAPMAPLPMCRGQVGHHLGHLTERCGTANGRRRHRHGYWSLGRAVTIRPGVFSPGGKSASRSTHPRETIRRSSSAPAAASTGGHLLVGHEREVRATIRDFLAASRVTATALLK